MGITYGDYLIDSGYYDPPEEEPMPITELADRIEVYLEDAPSSGGHSDAAGADAWELLREAMDELRRLQKAKQRALAIADERSKENVALRAAQNLQRKPPTRSNGAHVANLQTVAGRTESERREAADEIEHLRIQLHSERELRHVLDRQTKSEIEKLRNDLSDLRLAYQSLSDCHDKASQLITALREIPGNRER